MLSICNKRISSTTYRPFNTSKPADQVRLAAGAHGGVAVGFADVGAHAVDFCVGGVGEEGEGVGALADDVA